MNFLDKTISFFSPEAGLRRAQARNAEKIIRSYEAAKGGRRTAGWRTTENSINITNAQSLSRLRARSRDLGRNNPWAKKAIKVIRNNTVGSGIRLAAENQEINKIWNDWANSTDCDFDGRLNFYGMQALAMSTIAEGGEVIIRRRRNSNLSARYQLQIFEGDVIDTSKNSVSLSRNQEKGSRTVNGVSFGADGRRNGYWLFPMHPGENVAMVSEFVPIDEVIHGYELIRPGQVRGVPFGTSAMLRLKDFDDYEDAQLVRQKIAACFAAFVIGQDPSDTLGLSNPSGNATEIDAPERMEPGMITTLPGGTDVKFGAPPPAEGYKDYSKNILLAIAAGYGITYEALTGDLGGVNFSSGRMGWLEMHRNLLDWQKNIIISQICEGVFKWFIEGVQVGVSEEIEKKHRWITPRREMIDPVKETKAMADAIKAKLISWQDAVRTLGADPLELLAALKQDQEWFEQYGIQLVPNAPDSTSGNDDSDDSDD